MLCSLLLGITSGWKPSARADLDIILVEFWVQALQKEFGTWEYVTGMTGRSWMGKRGVDGHEVAMSDLRDFCAQAN